MKPEIIDIAPKYKTDKNEHGYFEYYAKHLPATAKKILEIGVLTGESIRMWKELYPECHVYGLDLFQENPIPFEAEWVTWFKGSQTDGKLLDDIRLHGPFDIAIDDGSHNTRHQLITFYGLVGCCKLYVVEDLQTNKEEFYRQGMDYYWTLLSQVKQFASIFNGNTSLYLDKIAFIYP